MSRLTPLALCAVIYSTWWHLPSKTPHEIAILIGGMLPGLILYCNLQYLVTPTLKKPSWNCNINRGNGILFERAAKITQPGLHSQDSTANITQVFSKTCFSSLFISRKKISTRDHHHSAQNYGPRLFRPVLGAKYAIWKPRFDFWWWISPRGRLQTRSAHRMIVNSKI